MSGQEDVKKYSPFFRFLNRAVNIVACITAFSIFVVVITQIIGRLIGYPAPWTEEATRFIFIWMIFLGISLGYRKAESPRVTILYNNLPKIFQRISRWIYTIGTLVFFLFMLVYGIELMRQQITMNEMSSVLMIPTWIIGVSIPISALIGILHTIQSLIYHRELI